MSQFQILGRGPPPFKAISNLSAYTNIFDAISFPGKACGRYTLSGDESISWIYSTEKNPTMAM